MKLLGGLSIDDRFMFLSFASFKNGRLIPYLDSIKELPSRCFNLLDFIKEHIEDIDKEIRRNEKKYSFKTEKIYFSLPSSQVQKVIVEDSVSLKPDRYNKRITYKDIILAKKQVEDIALDWQDLPVHHLVLGYDIEGTSYKEPPIGVWARKIKVKSLIIFIRKKLFNEFMSLFDNVDRKFAGFVYEAISDYSSVFDEGERDLSLICNIKHKQTFVSCFFGARPIMERSFDFGEKDVIGTTAYHFSLPPDLIYQLLFNYSTFSEVSLDKEISIRNKNHYVNLSATSLNSLLKEATRAGLEGIISSLKEELPSDDFHVSFIGRLTKISGFYDFTEGIFPFRVKKPFFERTPLSAFGCVKYGVSKFLERYYRDEPLFRKISRVYKEYF